MLPHYSTQCVGFISLLNVLTEIIVHCYHVSVVFSINLVHKCGYDNVFAVCENVFN